MKYYAIRNGRRVGVFTSWDNVKALVDGYQGAEYKSFTKKSDAEKWLNPSKDSDSDDVKEATVTVKEVKVYIDGSTFNNGKSNRRGGFGVFYSDNNPKNVSRGLPAETVTNNRAELSAFIYVLKHNKKKKLLVITDSIYNFNCFNGVKQWKNNGWKLSSGKPATNVDLLKKLYKRLKERNWSGVTLKKVDAHQKNPGKSNPGYEDWYGNDMADRLSKMAGMV